MHLPSPPLSPAIPASKPIKRVAVIGAGSAGITQAKQLLDAFARSEYALELVVFEARKEVGGVWVEDPEAGEFVTRYDENGEVHILSAEPGVLPSPIYAGLRTNLPHDLMTYRSTPFPSSTELYPKAIPVLNYLQSYARSNGVLPYIRFERSVTRVYKDSDSGLVDESDGITGGAVKSGGWTIESESVEKGEEGEGKLRERFDYVSIANGHYEKVWIPNVLGMKGFTGQIIHSKFYRHPETYRGLSILIVGSLSSGSDLARELASLNCPSSSLPKAMRIPCDAPQDPDEVPSIKTRVVQSSRAGNGEAKPEWENKDREGEPWVKFIQQKGLIRRFENPSLEERERGARSRIVFGDGSEVGDVDIVIYATGYSYYLPFLKLGDEPWIDPGVRPLEKEISEVDVVGRGGQGKGRASTALGGMQGQGMRNLDETQMFLRDDRSLAFLGLPYMIVPFQLCESQSHLIALLWAGRLPHFPAHPERPTNPKDEGKSSPTPTSDQSTNKTAGPPTAGAPRILTTPPTKRHTELTRPGLVYGFPYEFEYQDWLAELCAEAYVGGEEEREEEREFWKVAKGRWERRADSGLRKRTLGY